MPESSVRETTYERYDEPPYLLGTLRNTYRKQLRTLQRRPRTVELAVDDRDPRARCAPCPRRRSRRPASGLAEWVVIVQRLQQAVPGSSEC